MDRLGLSAETVGFAEKPGKKPDEVVEQFPSPGARVTEKTPVRLTLQKSPDERKRFETLAAPALFLFEYKLPPGLLNRRIRVEMTAFDMTMTMADDFFKPGQTLRFLVPKTQNAEIVVYEDDEPVAFRTF